MGNESTPDSSGSSGKRSGVQAQRKFAQGAPTLQAVTRKKKKHSSEESSSAEDFLTSLVFKESYQERYDRELSAKWDKFIGKKSDEEVAEVAEKKSTGGISYGPSSSSGSKKLRLSGRVGDKSKTRRPGPEVSVLSGGAGDQGRTRITGFFSPEESELSGRAEEHGKTTRRFFFSPEESKFSGRAEEHGETRRPGFFSPEESELSGRAEEHGKTTRRCSPGPEGSGLSGRAGDKGETKQGEQREDSFEYVQDEITVISSDTIKEELSSSPSPVDVSPRFHTETQPKTRVSNKTPTATISQQWPTSSRKLTAVASGPMSKRKLRAGAKVTVSGCKIVDEKSKRFHELSITSMKNLSLDSSDTSAPETSAKIKLPKFKKRPRPLKPSSFGKQYSGQLWSEGPVSQLSSHELTSQLSSHEPIGKSSRTITRDLKRKSIDIVDETDVAIKMPKPLTPTAKTIETYVHRFFKSKNISNKPVASTSYMDTQPPLRYQSQNKPVASTSYMDTQPPLRYQSQNKPVASTSYMDTQPPLLRYRSQVGEKIASDKKLFPQQIPRLRSHSTKPSSSTTAMLTEQDETHYSYKKKTAYDSSDDEPLKSSADRSTFEKDSVADLNYSASDEEPLAMMCTPPVESLSYEAEAINLEKPMVAMSLHSEQQVYDFNLKGKKKLPEVKSTGHLFYIPVQGTRHIIEGVGVNISTSPDTSEKIIMRAKLVESRIMAANTSHRVEAVPSTSRVIEITARANQTQDPMPSTSHTQDPMPSTSRGFEIQAGTSHGLEAVASSSGEIEINAGTSHRTGFGIEVQSLYPSDTEAWGWISGTSQLQLSVGNTTLLNQHLKGLQEIPNTMPFEIPTFRPSDKEFKNSLKYIREIFPNAVGFGVCRILPPATFKGECTLSDTLRFTPLVQYVNRLFKRWGPSSRFTTAIRSLLPTVDPKTPKLVPKLNGIEVDLRKLLSTVDTMGGLEEITSQRMWIKVAKKMGIVTNSPQIPMKLQKIYWKYILPYRALGNDEREVLLSNMDKKWELKTKYPDLDSDQSLDDLTDDMDDCIIIGKSITLGAFHRLAEYVNGMFCAEGYEVQEVERAYWQYVTKGDSHVCVYNGSVECSSPGCGFPSKTHKGDASHHSWNLKVLANNPASVLRALGPMCVTDPALHFGMRFSSSCWSQDPHGLPWIEYLHKGAPKIWYSVTELFNKQMRSAFEDIAPEFYRKHDKELWLLADKVMIPPSELMAHGVPVCRTVQNPGEYVVVYPGAYTSSICTGYSVSESVFFAPNSWLQIAPSRFKTMLACCEPAMFSFDKLIISVSTNSRAIALMKLVQPILEKIVQEETSRAYFFKKIGLKIEKAKKRITKKAIRCPQSEKECEICRKHLFLSMVTNIEDQVFYCPLHAYQLLSPEKSRNSHPKLQKDPGNLTAYKYIVYYSIDELNKLYSIVVGKMSRK